MYTVVMVYGSYTIECNCHNNKIIIGEIVNAEPVTVRLETMYSIIVVESSILV